MAIVDPIGGPVWISPESEGGLEIALLAELGEYITSIAVEMLGESVGPNIHTSSNPAKSAQIGGGCSSSSIGSLGSYRCKSPNWSAIKSRLPKVIFLPSYILSVALLMLMMIPI